MPTALGFTCSDVWRSATANAVPLPVTFAGLGERGAAILSPSDLAPMGSNPL